MCCFRWSVVGIFVVDAIFQVTRINHDLQTAKSRRLSYLRFGDSFLFAVKKRSFETSRYSVAVVGTHTAQQQVVPRSYHMVYY